MSNGSNQNFGQNYGQGHYGHSSTHSSTMDQEQFQSYDSYNQKNQGYSHHQGPGYDGQGRQGQHGHQGHQSSGYQGNAYQESAYQGQRHQAYGQQEFYGNPRENQPFVLPEPIRALSQHGLISAEEEALAKSFYREVCESGLLPKLVKDAESPVHQRPEFFNANNKEALTRVRGIFALLDAVDDRMLATVCALILELSTNGENRPLSVEDVGRRVMGYPSPDSNRAAGGTLLRAALWMVRFGYNNPTVCTAMMHEKQMKLRTARPQRTAA